MAISLPQVTKYALVSLVVLGVGLGLGSLVAFELRVHRDKIHEAERRKQQDEQTSVILGKMKTLKVGDTLKDFTFEDLSGHPVRLSEHITGLTWIAVMEPTCETCVMNARLVKSTLPDSVSARAFVFISGSDPRLMRDLKDTIGLRSQFLYDHRRQWINEHKFNAFPFHMLVDQTLRIKEIVVGDLAVEKIKVVS